MPVHDFTCPDCGLNCQLTTPNNGAPGGKLCHQLPECSTYKATKGDGQKFLELAFLARQGSAATIIGGGS